VPGLWLREVTAPPEAEIFGPLAEVSLAWYVGRFENGIERGADAMETAVCDRVALLAESGFVLACAIPGGKNKPEVVARCQFGEKRVGSLDVWEHFTASLCVENLWNTSGNQTWSPRSPLGG